MTELIQVSIASDGRIKAVYANNDVLVLSAAGSVFAVTTKEGTARQTCEFAVSKISEQLCAAISFRNMHVDSVVWCRAMSKKHAQDVFSIRYPISFVRWPDSLQAAVHCGSLQVRNIYAQALYCAK
jgi:Domain of unknown function (DUF4524)